MTAATILTFDRVARDGSAPADLAVDDLVIAGWTGRDAAALEAHIVELEALGVPRPKSTPLFYRVAAGLLTTAGEIQVPGTDSTGEGEVVLFAFPDGPWVGLGSDHTDRKLETAGITVAKQACAKPVAPALWRYEDVAPHWDELVLRAHVTTGGARRLYQEGPLTAMRHPDELTALYQGREGALAPGTVMFCGTLAVVGGIAWAERFEMALEDPVLGRSISHGYDVRPLPVEG